MALFSFPDPIVSLSQRGLRTRKQRGSGDKGFEVLWLAGTEQWHSQTQVTCPWLSFKWCTAMKKFNATQNMPPPCSFTTEEEVWSFPGVLDTHVDTSGSYFVGWQCSVLNASSVPTSQVWTVALLMCLFGRSPLPSPQLCILLMPEVIIFPGLLLDADVEMLGSVMKWRSRCSVLVDLQQIMRYWIGACTKAVSYTHLTLPTKLEV